MMTWLKKFVLDILPSVAATIIGAYIVNHYIIPKSPAGQSQPSIAAAVSDAFGSKATDSTEKASFEKGVAEKTAIERTAEKAASDKAVAAEPRRQTASVTPAAKSSANSAAVETSPATDVRRANDLARAAIERLRGAHPESKEAKGDGAKLPDAPRIQPVSTVASTVVAPSVPAMQPLPPAINVTMPNPDVFEQGNATPIMRQPYPQSAARSEESRRFVPPADIPVARPLDLRAQASAVSSDRTSIADDVVSTAKSMFHAVIPQ